MAASPVPYRSLGAACVMASDWLQDLAAAGTDLRVGAFMKVLHEAHEFHDDPCVEEAADVLIALIGALDHEGINLSDLAHAVTEKVLINRTRTWHQQPDGTFQHVPATP